MVEANNPEMQLAIVFGRFHITLVQGSRHLGNLRKGAFGPPGIKRGWGIRPHSTYDLMGPLASRQGGGSPPPLLGQRWPPLYSIRD